MASASADDSNPAACWLACALSKPGAWLDHPWDEDHNVAKVGSRIFFGMGAVQDEPSFTVKHEDLESRAAWWARYPDALEAAPYLRNKPWSRVFPERGMDGDDLRELIDESYAAVVRRLAKKHRPPGWDADL